MKNKNISIENGLEISLKVLDELKKHKLNNVSIEIEKDSEFLEIDTGD